MSRDIFWKADTTTIYNNNKLLQQCLLGSSIWLLNHAQNVSISSHSSVCLSEFFAENLGDFFIFLRRFADDILETSAESLEQILNFITVFMGNVERYLTSSFTSAVEVKWKEKKNNQPQ